MSQQLQITGGAKVRDLQDVIIGTSGVLSSLAFNVANGVPKLDVNGKILVSQLPNSVMEYQGTWNAATNTPTLVNGTGNQGDVYLCNVAGTTNFGAGPITFAVGDSAIYSGTIWQRAGGATGTVTSVGLTSTGNDAITITGSPITTSGNINLGFAGTNLQYINGAGDLTTFPTLISSIGLTMPSAFSVANSPLTANGTIAVTGAGYPSQYIRGDGTLADFPTSGGGGSSVSYYLNGGTSQGTIGGVTYYEMSKTADTGTGVDFNKTGNGLIVSFLTDAGDPAQLNIPAGNWNYEIYASMSSNGGTPQLYAELYVYDGTTFTLISTSSNEILYDGVNLNLYTFAMAVPATTLALTDRLAVKLYATNSGGKTTTVHTQDSHLCQIITTFSTGITALNGLTAQVQYFATGTSGTDFNISSATATHTFNLPVASASNTGKLSSTDWSTFNGKVPYTGANANVDLGYFNFDANEIRGASIIAKLNGLASSPFILMTGSSGYIFGYDAISMISSPTTANTLIITSNIGVITKTAQIGLGSLTATRTYTLPDASGTLPLLESTQTFTGANTFSGLSSFTFSSGTRMDYGPYLTKGSVPTVFSGTTTNIYSDATTNNIVIRDTSSIAKLVFDNSTQTYTFPSASGTIALTSNLSSYVPYTGATGAVNLGAYKLTAASIEITGGTGTAGNLTFGQSDAFSIPSANNSSIDAITTSFSFAVTAADSTYKYFKFETTALTNNTLRSYTLPDANGTLPLGTGTTNYHAKWTGTSTIGNSLIWDNGTNVGIGNTNTSYTLDVTGTGRFTSTLLVSGTATFSSIIYGSNGNLDPTAGTNAGTTLALNGNSAANNYSIGLTAIRNSAYDMFFQTGATNGGGYRWYIGTSEKMTMSSTGNVGIGTTTPSYKLDVVSLGSPSARVRNGDLGGTATLLLETANNFSGTCQTYIKCIGSTGTGLSNLAFGTAGASGDSTATERMRITSGGTLRFLSQATYGSLTYEQTIQYATSPAGIWFGNSFNSNGNVGIQLRTSNDGTSVQALTLNPTGTATFSSLGTGTVTATSGTLSTVSDMNLKDEDGFIDNALEKVLNLKPRYFYWKEESGLPTDLRQLGFYAQEVNQALGEEAANTPKTENDNWGIYDRGIIAMLTKAIQELSAQNKELNDRLTKAGL